MLLPKELKTNTLNQKMIVIACTLLAIIVSLAPYQADSTLGSDAFRSVTRILSYLLTVILIIGLITNHKKIDVGVLIPIVYWFITTFNVYGREQLQLSLLNIIILICIFLVPRDLGLGVIKLFRKYMVIICFLGIVCYIAYFFKLGLPYKIVPYYSSLFGEQYYANYGVSFIYIKSVQVRLCGLFNEPGFLGTVCALLICLDIANFKRITNWIIFIGGCLSFSLAFLLILAIYISLISIKKKSVLLLVILFMIFYFFILPKINFNNYALDYLVQRITLSGGGFFGNDRSNVLLDSAFSSLFQSDKVLFGYGGGYSSQLTSGVSTYKTMIIDYGFVGCILMYGSLLLYALAKYKNNWFNFCFTVVFFLSVYQRPGIFIATYFVIFLFGHIYIQMAEKKSVGNNEVGEIA